MILTSSDSQMILTSYDSPHNRSREAVDSDQSPSWTNKRQDENGFFVQGKGVPLVGEEKLENWMRGQLSPATIEAP